MRTGEQVRGSGTLSARPKGHRGSDDVALSAFLDAIDCVLVEPPFYHGFSGAIPIQSATSIWQWLSRDVARSEAGRLADAINSGAEPVSAFDLLQPEILDKLKANAAVEAQDYERERRNTIQMGGEEVRKLLPAVIMAMRRRALLQQATAFGTAVGTMQDEPALAAALQTITISNPVTRALWMQAMVGHISNPSRVMAAAVLIAGGTDEVRITNSGYAPLVDAILSHAQVQIGRLDSQPGVFSDIDLSCKAIERFHRLMRAINYTLEIDRRSHWGTIINSLTAMVSERLERPLREVNLNVTQALRRPREGADKVDSEKVLGALNGMYLLNAVRNARDSLALNAVLDQAWTDTGQAIEVLVTRTLDIFRSNPADAVNRERLEAGIKLAEIRFNPEYAEILRRTLNGASRRAATS